MGSCLVVVADIGRPGVGDYLGPFCSQVERGMDTGMMTIVCTCAALTVIVAIVCWIEITEDR